MGRRKTERGLTFASWHEVRADAVKLPPTSSPTAPVAAARRWTRSLRALAF